MRLKFSLELGILNRNSVINGIRKYCNLNKLKLQIEEYKSWLSSEYLIVVEGDQNKVINLRATLRNVSNES